eukprot:4581495-Alexandrium_andersonii.AAC.1
MVARGGSSTPGLGDGGLACSSRWVGSWHGPRPASRLHDGTHGPAGRGRRGTPWPPGAWSAVAARVGCPALPGTGSPVSPAAAGAFSVHLGSSARLLRALPPARPAHLGRLAPGGGGTLAPPWKWVLH